MKNNSGFTLIELLLVLSIWTILMIVSVPIVFKSLEKHEEKLFLKTLEYDILTLQYLSVSSGDKNIHINIRENYYTVRGGISSSIITRNFPPSWEVDTRVFNTISFTPNGTIKQPGTFIIKTKHSTYSFIFPFGKGRGYFVKQ